MNLKKLRLLQQQASEYAGEWKATGGRIIDTQNEEVAKVVSQRLATYICMIHNTWLILSNHILLLHRALADRKAMSDVTRKEL